MALARIERVLARTTARSARYCADAETNTAEGFNIVLSMRSGFGLWTNYWKGRNYGPVERVEDYTRRVTVEEVVDSSGQYCQG